ncbi:MAG: type II toxin-antitoxin system HicB family antitoxin [Planctomycetota bacterium]
MKTCIIYKEDDGWYVGHIREYPDYESQGTTLEELKRNLLEIYNDIKEGLVPDAKPSKIFELVV